MTDRPPLPVACSLSGPTLAKRRAGLFTDLARRRQEVRWLAAGGHPTIRLRTGDIGAIGRIYPARKRMLRFQLTVEPGGGPVWLELTRPPGTREFLAEEIAGPAVV
jgi:hypothetical protein